MLTVKCKRSSQVSVSALLEALKCCVTIQNFRNLLPEISVVQLSPQLSLIASVLRSCLCASLVPVVRVCTSQQKILEYFCIFNAWGVYENKQGYILYFLCRNVVQRF